MPLPTARRWHTTSVQRGRNFPQGRRTGLLRLTDDGEDIGGKPVSLGCYGLHSALAGLMKPWVAQGDPTGLRGR